MPDRGRRSRWLRCRRCWAGDGEGATCRWRARQPQLTTACQAFRGVLGANVLICKLADPGAKGIIDRCRTTWNAHARQPVLTSRLQPPAERLAGAGQSPPETIIRLRPCEPDRRRQGGRFTLVRPARKPRWSSAVLLTYDTALGVAGFEGSLRAGSA